MSSQSGEASELAEESVEMATKTVERVEEATESAEQVSPDSTERRGHIEGTDEFAGVSKSIDGVADANET